VTDKAKALAFRDYYNAVGRRVDEIADRALAGDPEAKAAWPEAFALLSEMAVRDEMAGAALGRGQQARKIMSDAARVTIPESPAARQLRETIIGERAAATKLQRELLTTRETAGMTKLEREYEAVISAGRALGMTVGGANGLMLAFTNFGATAKVTFVMSAACPGYAITDDVIFLMRRTAGQSTANVHKVRFGIFTTKQAFVERAHGYGEAGFTGWPGLVQFAAINVDATIFGVRRHKLAYTFFYSEAASGWPAIADLAVIGDVGVQQDPDDASPVATSDTWQIGAEQSGTGTAYTEKILGMSVWRRLA